MVTGESASKDPAITGKAAFFEPLIFIVPFSGLPPLMINLSNSFYF